MNTKKTPTPKQTSALPAILICICCMLLLIVQCTATISEQPLALLYRDIAVHPANILTHILLAQRFFEARNFTQAREQLTDARAYVGAQSNVLGSMSDVDALEKNISEYDQKKQAIYTFWENITKENPHYIDAWQELVITARNYGEDLRANSYIEQLRKIDPLAAKEIEN